MFSDIMDDMDAERVDRLTFGFEESVEKSTIFQFVVSSCIERYKNPLARLLDGMDCADFSVVSSVEDEIYEKFIQGQKDYDVRDSGRLINGLTRTLVRLIEKWRKFIDVYIFYPKNQHPLCSIDFLNCLAMNDRGMIDYITSAKNLIAEPTISAEDKLKIASVHCLKDEILKLIEGSHFPELSEKTYEKTKRIVQFWKMYITENKYSESIEEMIKIIGYDNQNGLIFFWQKLSQTQKNRVIKDIFRHAGLDLQIQWLDGMTNKQQEWIMRRCGGYVLINLMENEQWKRKFYEVANFARYLLPSQHYFEVIYAASGGVPYARTYFPTNDEHFQMFEHMWELAPRHAKDYIFQQEKSLNLFWFLRKVPVYDFFKQFFTQAPQAFKKKFIDCWNGMSTLSNIHSDEHEPELFHYLVHSTFPNEQDAVDFKIRFMNEDFGIYIINDSGIYNCEKRPLDVVLKDMFFTDEAIEKFKRQYLYESKSVDELGDRTKKAFFVEKHGQEFQTELKYDQIIDYVRQYIPEEEIETFKKIALCQNNHVKKVFLNVMKKDRYDLVDIFLKWSINDDQLIAEYKSNFYIEELNFELKYWIPELVEKDNFETLMKFDSWCNMSDENRRQMGDMILEEHDSYRMLSMWRYLLFQEHFDMATNFLKFCGRKTEEEIQNAKNALIVDINWIYIIHGVKNRWEVNREGIENPIEEEILATKSENIFLWFDPSDEAKVKFIEKMLKEQGYLFRKKRSKN